MSDRIIGMSIAYEEEIISYTIKHSLVKTFIQQLHLNISGLE